MDEETVGRLAADVLGAQLSAAALGRALDRIGLAPRHPLQQAPDADADWLADWRRDRLPELRAEAAQHGGALYLAGSAAVPGTEPVTLISTVTGRGGLRFAALPGAPGAGHAEEFCAQLLSDAGGPVVLVVHGGLGRHFPRQAGPGHGGLLRVVTTRPYGEPEPCLVNGRGAAARRRRRPGAVLAPGLPTTRFTRCQAANRPLLAAEGGRRQQQPNL